MKRRDFLTKAAVGTLVGTSLTQSVACSQVIQSLDKQIDVEGHRVFTIEDAGFSLDSYKNTPINIINRTLAYMASFGGGTLILPNISVRINIGEENDHSYSGLARVIIPARRGLWFRIVGGGMNAPFYLTQDKLTGKDTKDWNLFNVGDQKSGKECWSFITKRSGSDDPAAIGYENSRILDFVQLQDITIIGDEPDGKIGLKRNESYQYHIGGVRLSGARIIKVNNVQVYNVLNSCIVLAFAELMIAEDCYGAQSGHRKAKYQPANFIDIVGMGSNYAVKSKAIIRNCHCADIYNVAYMGIWSDVTISQSSCIRTLIAVEHQASWAETQQTDIGGNYTVENCYFDCDVSYWQNEQEFLRLGDAIITNGGKNKTFTLRDTRITSPSNMAVAGYMQDSSVLLDNVTIENVGHGRYSFPEFPAILARNGDLHISGGRVVKCNKGLIQLLGRANLTWGNRSIIQQLDAKVLLSKGVDTLFHSRLHLIDSKARMYLGESDQPSYNYDVDIKFDNFQGKHFIDLASWNGKSVEVGGKFKLDCAGTKADFVPLHSQIADNKAQIELQLDNISHLTPPKKSNTLYGYIHPDSYVYINRFEPLRATQKKGIGVDFIRCKDSTGTFGRQLDNLRFDFVNQMGLQLNQLSCLGSVVASKDDTLEDALQVNPNEVDKVFSTQQWTVLMRIGDFRFYLRNVDKLQGTDFKENSTTKSVKPLAMAYYDNVDETATTDKQKLELFWWDNDGFEQIVLQLEEQQISLPQSPLDGDISLALSCHGDGRYTLAVNGRTQQLNTDTLIKIHAFFIGLNERRFTDINPEMVDCFLKSFTVLQTSFYPQILQKITSK
ncbi:hypothetical protein [Vibrio sp. MA40-2]|uniref:hypothetical protein n=1 Tax=Vibrio sp. MA40-2 TaxID=3391828 RepID=UPI0039A6CB92